jgi:hypothetical protein
MYVDDPMTAHIVYRDASAGTIVQRSERVVNPVFERGLDAIPNSGFVAFRSMIKP